MKTLLRHKYLFILLAILALGLGLRVGRCLSVNRMDKDSIIYIGMAKDWAQKGADFAFTRNARIPPLYISVMALGEKCGLDAEFVGRFVSVLAGSLLVLAAHIIGVSIFRKKYMGLVAAFLVAVHPYLIRASEEVMRESLFICLFGFALAFGVLGAKNKKLWCWAAAGFFTSLAVMTRSEGMGILILAAIWCGVEFVLSKKWGPANMVRHALPLVMMTFMFFLFALPVELMLSRTSSEWTVVDKRLKGYLKKAFEREEVKKGKDVGAAENLKNFFSGISLPGKTEEKDLKIFNKGKIDADKEQDSEEQRQGKMKYVQLPPPANPEVFISHKTTADSGLARSEPEPGKTPEAKAADPEGKKDVAEAKATEPRPTNVIYFARFTSLSKWIDFTNLFLDSVFPLLIILVLLVFALTSRGLYVNSPQMRLFLVAFGIEFASRFYVFFSGIPFERRYMISTTFIVAILASPGLPRLVEVARGLSLKFGRPVAVRTIAVVVILLVGLLSAGKGLNPHKDKKWMREIPKIINAKCPAGKKPILVSDISDHRIAYYAKAEFVKLSTENDDIHYKMQNGKIMEMDPDKRVSYGILLQSGVGEHYGTWLALELPFGLRHFADNIRALGGSNVFILIEEDDEAFRARFASEKALFPLKLVATFKDRNKTMVNLYQFLSLGEMEKKYGRQL